jgi:hypothetical protein
LGERAEANLELDLLPRQFHNKMVVPIADDQIAGERLELPIVGDHLEKWLAVGATNIEVETAVVSELRHPDEDPSADLKHMRRIEKPIAANPDG